MNKKTKTKEVMDRLVGRPTRHEFAGKSDIYYHCTCGFRTAYASSLTRHMRIKTTWTITTGDREKI